MRKIFLIAVVVLAIAGIIYFITIKASQVSSPSTMPLVVNESMDALLQSLEIELKQHHPGIIQFLKPGITLEELERAEAILGQAIHPEMQALYRWHNGLANDKELFFGHGFLPLENAIQMNQEFTRYYQEKGLSFFMAHEKNWLMLFPDGAGDGYYYDPKHSYETGGIFYNIRESSYYRYFPSIKNLVKAIIESYQSGVYPQDAKPNLDIEKQIMIEEEIMNKYGVEVVK